MKEFIYNNAWWLGPIVGIIAFVLVILFSYGAVAFVITKMIQLAGGLF